MQCNGSDGPSLLLEEYEGSLLIVGVAMPESSAAD